MKTPRMYGWSRKANRKQGTLRLFFLGLIVLAILHLPGLAQEAADAKQSPHTEAIASFIDFATKQMKADRIPGLSIGFMKDDHFWTQGLGYSDLENQVLAKPQSSYRMASISKTFTAIAVLQLVEAGKIELDKEVQIYVPYFPRKKWPITVRQLLGHLGGISHYNSDEEQHIKVHKNTKEALEIFQHFDLVAEPETKYHYSSYGYNLLGAVIEVASDQSYGDYITEHIFKPLGMTDSRPESPRDLIPHRVRGYRLVDSRIQNSEFIDISSRFAAGGTRSTVVDLLKYARAICEGRLLKKETWKVMFTPIATKNGYLIRRGMSWNVSPWKGHFQVSHGGSQPETITYLLIFPTERFAAAVCANLERAKVLPYIRRLTELVLDQDLDSSAYLPNRQEQALYSACMQTFSHGLSRYDYFGEPEASDPRALKRAFDYFNQNVHTRAINADPKRVTKSLRDGIHPVSQSAFTQVGAHMASVLGKTYGKDRLQDYHQNPLDFFSDYIRLKDPEYKLSRSISQMIALWEKDWARTYPEYLRYLHISADTDFEVLLPRLRKTFAKASIYPDFSQELRDAAGIFISRNDMGMTIQILSTCVEVYPDDPYNLLSLGNAYLLAGDEKKAHSFYKKSHALSPIDLRYFQELAARLDGRNKMPELLSLSKIFVKLYPKNALVHKIIAGTYLKLGEVSTAIKHYQKALKFDPSLEGIEAKLKELLKK